MATNLCFEETTAWLRDAKTPSIRYLTLTQLQGKAEGEAEATAIRLLIPTTSPVEEILAAQQPGGFWIADRNYYSPKYRSSHWSMLLLTELALDPAHASLRTGADYLQERVFQSPGDYFVFKKGVGCFWGNWLRYQLYCGNYQDARIQEIIARTCVDIHRKGKCAYNYGLPCAWGVARDLYGLALIPEKSQDSTVQDAIQAGIQFLLAEYDLLKADYPYKQKIHPLWSKLSFPLFYQADILFVLRVLKALNALDHPGAQQALAWLAGQAAQNGQWHGGSPYRNRTWPFTAPEDSANHWLTLQALQVLA